MNPFQIVWKNMKQRSLASVLTIISVVLGAALIVSIITIRSEVQNNFSQSAIGYELVAGAKGSPLQLVLNTVYHLDAPTGNLPYSFYEKLKRDPRVKLAVPYGLGDNYKGHRLVGTTTDLFIDFEYMPGRKFEIGEGRVFQKDFEAVIGSEVARKMHLRVGDEFIAAHGIIAAAETEADHKEMPFQVVGVMAPSKTPNDRAIFITLDSVHRVHAKHPEEDAEHEESNEDKEVTSVIIKLKSPLLALLLHRQINEGSVAQAAFPAMEIKGLFSIIGNAQKVLLGISYLVIVVAAISVLVSIYNSMNERKREIAIMRALGASKLAVFRIIVFESSAICITGGILGVLLGHVVVMASSGMLERISGITVSPFTFSILEPFLIAGMVILGIVTGLLPAAKAYRTDVAQNLSPTT